jgi:hypothetical protein
MKIKKPSNPAEMSSTGRADYLAANPKAAKLQAVQLAEFHARFTAMTSGLKTILHGIVDKAEQSRQIGIVLIEFVETLPGKRLTPDFYEQLKPEFTDDQGRLISLELLEWFMKVAHHNLDPISNFETALKWRQPLLLATGDPDFKLEITREAVQRPEAKDEWGRLKEWMSNPDLEDWWTKLHQNAAYFPKGRMRPDLRAMMAEEWKPKFKVLDELRTELGI